MNISKKTLLLLSFFISMNAHEASQKESLERGVSISDSALGEDTQMRFDDSTMSSDNEELEGYSVFQKSSDLEGQRPAVKFSLPMEHYHPDEYGDFISKLEKLRMAMPSQQRSSTPLVPVRKREAVSQEKADIGDDSDNEDSSEHFNRAYKRKKR
jgi:hypothetical protein